jgi:uncharacterized YccA/Bax inhibitor family protein
MALFQSGNPTLSEKIFERSVDRTETGLMTVRGSIVKFGFLLMMVIVGAVYTWNMYYNLQQGSMMTLLWVGLIGGMITGLVIAFKPTLAKYLAPAYGLLEGFVLGAFSAIINDMFKERYPNLVISAVGLTFGVAVAMFLLYSFRIIKPTQKFRAVIVSSIVGIGIFYLITILLSLFHIYIPFMQIGNSSLLGIGINLFIVAIAALSLILDFEMIEVGANTGAPKYMEWYGAWGLLVTMVWLYLEILKLLSRFANNRS